MAGIFLSYRRDDSGGYAGRLADDLKQAFAGDQVWRDIEAIEAGADFVDAIGKAIGSCSVLLALIGPRWLDAKNTAARAVSTIRAISCGSRSRPRSTAVCA